MSDRKEQTSKALNALCDEMKEAARVVGLAAAQRDQYWANVRAAEEDRRAYGFNPSTEAQLRESKAMLANAERAWAEAQDAVLGLKLRLDTAWSQWVAAHARVVKKEFPLPFSVEEAEGR